MLLGATPTLAQTLNKPTPADNPNFSGNSPWTAACASATFNEYFVNFTWNTPLVDSSNEFILELSDASGSFSNPVELDRKNDKNTSFDFEFDFVLPTDIRGSGYKMRVRSTNPALTSPESDAFSMYYIDYDSPLLISENASGTIPPGGNIEICTGNTVTLAVHNVPNANTYQYNWYKSSTLLAEKSSSIEITQAGIYNVEIDYGSICSGSANTLSNDINISLGTNIGIAINDPAKTALCPGENQDLEANISAQGLTYVWYKDNVAITSPTIDDHIYTVDSSVSGFEGDYQVEISGPGTCLERSLAVTITNSGNFTVTRDNVADMVLLPSQTKTLSVTTTAISPSYQWYKDNAIVTGATNSSLDITDAGVYYVTVSQSGGACAATPMNSETTNVVSPASFELVVDYTTAYTACENTSIVLGVSTINAIAADDTKTDVTTDLINSFTYQWNKGGIAVNGETASSISLTSNTENGDYSLNAVLNTYNENSNTLPVQLLINETVTISSNSNVLCNGTNAIIINTTTDLTGATFEWRKDNIAVNSNNTSLSVSEPGTYKLVVQKNGCPLMSNEIVISPLNDNLVSLDTTESTIVIPEGTTKTITATGGATYQWFNVNNDLLSSTSSVDLTEEGDYILIANVGDCNVTKNITIAYKDVFNVPNLITPNGDGINDLWALPNTYSQDPNINVIIYNSAGKEIYNVSDYQNNWPEATTEFTRQNMVFYYKIKNTAEVLKQGTITVIR